MKNLTALDVLTTSPIMPVIAIQHLKDAIPLAKALISAGVKVLEITLRTDCALEAIRQIRESVPEAIVGASTVTTAEQYVQAIEAGAQFVISPGLTQSLLQKSQDYTKPFIPGVATPSELMLAAEYGFEFLKFFPAEINGGVKVLQAFSGPFAKVKFCPTGGVNEKNYLDYLALQNVLCVGGTWFVPKEAIEKGNFEQIHQLAKQAIDCVKWGEQ
ncbi:bifunctional 4-hydroxy-2-oxoglutarate aldolase/2-dehydro-3-deoxy-phosphogluconate aldolase [Rodentibacter sp. Ppn85]|uniref:bifunctional 4-hydroxy-2-oxoglutarate aldolase/2-dehydro-3-deoxy-phosphogluconate aldolase n=1 Tax=Rodentibacter sp. Ppn85 TaxID=1908525 RepID=UPI0009867AF6|nr:bifunctional 4-hydroxy-2-oxoglutarate aldolase/2-dehydro-3-deoxy-phosphogluconate aldolase [Rodentibacter sp. Ppn85]OOF63535.1 keto-deoxy-phosphogluconate aldolase [Rodentibacter sp. Ppn85]